MFMDFNMNLDHSYSNEASELLKESKEKFIEKAKEYVKDFAKIEDLDDFYDL